MTTDIILIDKSTTTEDAIILALGNSNFQRTITIDSCIIMAENLPNEIKQYRKYY